MGKETIEFAPLTGVNDMKEMDLSISHENPQLLPMLFAMQKMLCCDMLLIFILL